MRLELDFEHGDHGVLRRAEDDGNVIVVAYLPEGAQIGINEARLIAKKYDSVRTKIHSTPLSAEKVEFILSARENCMEG